ncbi:hypothetical protein AB0B27_10930, partial [Micromonospora rifamycinica]
MITAAVTGVSVLAAPARAIPATPIAETVGTNPPTMAEATTQSAVYDGPITRQEILDRAQYWVDRKYVYSPNAPFSYTWNTDADGKLYRNDCSGLVSEAWHLSTSYVTGDFQGGSPLWSEVPGGIDNLLPGDAVVTDGHIELFSHWVSESDHGKGAMVYSFNQPGETVENPYADTNFGKRGYDNVKELNKYKALRYTKILDQVNTTPAASTWASRTETGAMSVFTVRADGHVYTSWQGSPGAVFGNWYRIGSNGPAFTETPAEITNPSGAMSVFATGTDGNMYVSWQSSPGAVFGNWYRIGTNNVPLVGTPTVAAVSSGVMSVFATGTDGNVYTSWQSSPGAVFGNWYRIGTNNTALRTGATVLTGLNGVMSVFATGTDGNVYTS